MQRIEVLVSELRTIRRARGLTLVQLAEKVSVTEATMSRYENNPSKLNLPLMQRLAKALDCRLSDIAGETSFADNERSAGKRLNARPRNLIKAELEEVDSLSIRLLREFALTLDNAPERLRRLDDYAGELREELEAGI
jgi:transcriptional regulator with XRE-family HTH domain